MKANFVDLLLLEAMLLQWPASLRLASRKIGLLVCFRFHSLVVVVPRLVLVLVRPEIH